MTFSMKDDLQNLATFESDGPFISIYMQAYQAGPETRKNPIRFKNLATEAENRLKQSRLSSAKMQQLLEPLRALQDDYDFWQQQRQGLAVFSTAGLFQTYRLPWPVEEQIMVADRFYLTPLMRFLEEEAQFYLLALSQNQTRLFNGNRYQLNEIELEGVPTSLAEALRYDDPEKQQQFHTATATPRGAGGTGGAGRPAVFHGQGTGKDEVKDNLLRFFRQLDRGLADVFRQADPVPLVLAGVAYLFPIYREANTYPHLLDEGVTGNPEALNPETLHAQAWPLIEPHFKQERQAAIARYEDLSNTAQISREVTTIVPAAFNGRVDTLFVAAKKSVWGSFDPETNRANELEHPPENNNSDTTDLLDLAAIHTFLNGGAVYVMEPEQIPDQGAMGAIFRY